MNLVEFKQDSSLIVTATGEDGESISSQSVEALLMFAILEKLGEIRWGVFDIESVIRNR